MNYNVFILLRTQKKNTVRDKSMGRDLFQIHYFSISYFRKKSTYKRISILSSAELYSENETKG